MYVIIEEVLVLEGDTAVPGGIAGSAFVETALEVIPSLEGYIGLEYVVEHHEVHLLPSELHLVESIHSGDESLGVLDDVLVVGTEHLEEKLPLSLGHCLQNELGVGGEIEETTAAA